MVDNHFSNKTLISHWIYLFWCYVLLVLNMMGG